MFRSIRWTLQLWYAVILTVTVAALVGVLDYRLRHAELERINSELEAAAQGLLLGPDFSIDPARDASTEGEVADSDDAISDGNGLGQSVGGPVTTERRQIGDWWWRYTPPAILRRLSQGEGAKPYYVVWTRTGRVLRSSAPDLLPPADPEATRIIGEAIAQPGHAKLIDRGDVREMVVTETGRYPMRVLVGKSIALELQALDRFRLGLVGSGAGILLLGLAGGWFLTVRALRPIAEISATARAISGSNLSGRIPVAQARSELGSLVVTLNDAFQRLESAFERQVRFTSDASHELRTPLAVINANASLALAQPRTGPEYQEALGICQRAARRMGQLVESLLVLARADGNASPLQVAEFDLRAAVEESIDFVRDLAAVRRLRWEIEGAGGSLRSDRALVARVVTNLLTNAIRYNREGGTIKVTLRREGNGAVIEIADSGIGIPPEAQAHVFERFFRADSARSSTAGGTGLGLSICRHLVTLLGGTIAFTSAVGVGTTFAVRLPSAPGPL